MYPFPYFRAFTDFSPTIPDIYWNVYTQEERIKKICCEFHKMICYVDAMADVLNSQYAIIDQMRTDLPQIVADTIKTDEEIHAEILQHVDNYLAELMKGDTYNQLKEHGFIYDPDGE